MVIQDNLLQENEQEDLGEEIIVGDGAQYNPTLINMKEYIIEKVNQKII